MIPSRENVFRLMAKLEQSGSMPEHADDGPTSVFVCDRAGKLRLHPTQFVVRVSGDAVFVRFSRLPFVKPYVYSRQALKVAKLD